jgi:hypothetical protein
VETALHEALYAEAQSRSHWKKHLPSHRVQPLLPGHQLTLVVEIRDGRVIVGDPCHALSLRHQLEQLTSSHLHTATMATLRGSTIGTPWYTKFAADLETRDRREKGLDDIIAACASPLPSPSSANKLANHRRQRARDTAAPRRNGGRKHRFL